LDAHLALEEANVVPFLRDAREFPPPATDAEAEMYAQGFSWSLHGIDPEVVTAIMGMLPAILTSKLPAARAAFAARCERVWGTAKPAPPRLRPRLARDLKARARAGPAGGASAGGADPPGPELDV
jgi:hypothetical protein